MILTTTKQEISKCSDARQSLRGCAVSPDRALKERSWYGMGSLRFSAVDRAGKSDAADYAADSVVCVGGTLQQGRRGDQKRDQCAIRRESAYPNPRPRGLLAKKGQVTTIAGVNTET